MSRTTTIGRLLFDDIVPEELRAGVADDKPIDSGVAKDILQAVAEKAPDRYREISHALLKLGAKASTETNASFGLEDLKSPIDKGAIIRQAEAEEDAIMRNPKLTPEQKEAERIKLYFRHSSQMPDQIYGEALTKGSNLARMVASGARGNKGQLNSNIGADWLVVDPQGNPVPVPIKNSYSEGLTPAEYFASSYGTRTGLISTKFAVQDAGYLSKQLAAAAHDLVVTQDDCETNRGIPTSTDDKDNVGAVLARATAGYPAGTVIDARSMRDMKNKGVNRFLVRSPIVCGAHGGICARCAGVRERNRLPAKLDNIGLAASSSLSEPLSQGMLSVKHTGGVASAGSTRTVSGFKAVDSLVQVPDVFPGGAAIAQTDGKVSKIEDAPQGGKYIHIGDQRHYLTPDMQMNVKVGDDIEAGDAISDGIPNPAEVVKHKGIGAGRVYFVDAMRNAFKNNGISVNRRNIEVLARALVNHVKVTDPEGYANNLPDEITEYNTLEQDYTPAENTLKASPLKAIGSYLQRPTLHYSIGTRITPKIAKDLDELGEKEIDVSDQTPSFQPEMQRAMDVPAYKPDWMSQFSGSYLTKRLLKNVHSGDATSDIHGTSFVPGMAYGVEFGKPPAGKVGY